MHKYNNIDKHLHQLTQTLAKFGRSFATTQKDDSHTNLGFDFLGKRIWSKWAELNKDNYILNFNLNTQRFNLLNTNYQNLASFNTIGKTQENVENDIEEFLAEHLKVEQTDFLKPMHFEIPEYNFKNKPIQTWDKASVHQWINYRHQANLASRLLLNHLNLETEIRIWPHHFDTGIYVEPNHKMGIGFGLAMADTMIDEAYYYYSVYGLNGHKIDYSSVEPLSVGRWITNENWNGAVLPLSEIDSTNINLFLQETTQWTFKS